MEYKKNLQIRGSETFPKVEGTGHGKFETALL